MPAGRARWAPPAGHSGSTASPGGAERRLDSADVAGLVGQDLDLDISESGEIVAQRIRLVTAQLEQERAAIAQKARGLAQDPAQHLGAVATAVVRPPRLEGEGVS